MGGGPLGNVAWDKETLDNRLTWKREREEKKKKNAKNNMFRWENVSVAPSKTIFIVIRSSRAGTYRLCCGFGF